MAKKNSIFIKGARVNNLKNISIELPYNKLIVVTGVSGSGKSSLSIDTLYAEGQRRYVESLSSYARQFLMRMKKPDVDNISGLCPAIAIEQRVGNKNARSTVGTLTEVYDYLRILYARIGRTYSPISGIEVKKHAVSDVVDFLMNLEQDTRVLLLVPFLIPQKKSLEQALDFLIQKGYSRISVDAKVHKIETLLENKEETEKLEKNITKHRFQILIDRFAIDKNDPENSKRIADSVNTALYEGHGICSVLPEAAEERTFSTKFELDGILFEEPSPQLFNFNSSFGACTACEGYGQAIGIEEEKVVPNPSKSVYDDAVVCWKGEKVGQWKEELLKVAHKFDFPVHRPYKELSEEQKELLWEGNKYFGGIRAFFKELEAGGYKIQNRVMLARYRGKTTCPECRGSRLRKEALYVLVGGKTIAYLVKLPIEKLYEFFVNIELTDHEREIARRLLTEIRTRLKIMLEVGLSYLSIDRISGTLSGGEVQRIHLTRTLGSNLTSSLYVLDEPSIGLHPRDTNRLITVLKQLRDLGNTVVVVEHEEEIIAQSDFLVDVGPLAGTHGGEIVFAGPYEKIYEEANDSLTARYMSGRLLIPMPTHRRNFTSSISVKGAAQHNLKNLDVKFPLNTLTVVTGVSGSGKTTLVKSILYPALMKLLDADSKEKAGTHDCLEGDIKMISQVELISQQAIGKSSRSNPVTYVKAYDGIRNLYAKQQASKIQGFKAKHFSFNVEGGRCETCKGDGEILVSMQFLADVRLTCEECDGKRFQKEVLEVTYKDKSIYEVLDMTVDEALVFFKDQDEIVNRMRPLQDVGLGYIRLGQPSSTLSGGEGQRVKLASFLNKDEANGHVLFIFDEPTTGLHFHDINKLLKAFNALVEAGHSVIVIEHDMDVIKCADYIIDLGKEGGKEGGQLLFWGTPEQMLDCQDSYTADYLREKIYREREYNKNLQS
jgi:excinuclease ABC subunit A